MAAMWKTSSFINNATEVSLRSCCVAWGGKREAYHGPAIEARNAPGLIIEGFKGESAGPDKGEAIVRSEA